VVTVRSTPFDTLDFDAFHLDLTTDIDRVALAAPYAQGLGPIGFVLDDERAYTFHPGVFDDGRPTLEVRPGTHGATTVVTLSQSDWQAFATERWTRYGLLYNGRMAFSAGEFGDLCRWEPALRALFHGRPVYDPAIVRFVDRHGEPLDLGRSFTLDDDHADIAHFVQTTGYLHLRNVFEPNEIDALRHEVDRIVARAKPDDVHSWWTRTPDGDPTVCNLKYGGVGSAMVTDLHDDARLRTIVALAGESDLAPLIDRNEGTKIVVKNPGATEGLTDLPLHTDCGMGFHPITCPMVLIGVQLESGNARTGQMFMTAGSHRATTPDPAIVDVASWPIVALETAPGDCTVHFGHTLHGAPPPTGDLQPGENPRRTIYAAYAPPAIFAVLRPMEDLVAVMQPDDGVTTTVDEKLAKL
jgi:hypothetical protein